MSSAALLPAHVGELRVYPVKALRGSARDRIGIEPWGMAGDRRWMVVDSAGVFVTQRKFSAMALIAAVDGPGALVLSAGSEQLAVPLPGADAATLEVRVWRDTLRVASGGAAAA